MNKEQFFRGRKITLESGQTAQGWVCKFSILKFGKETMASSSEYAKGVYVTQEQAQQAALEAAQARILADISKPHV
jgi:hypothetical protein